MRKLFLLLIVICGVALTGCAQLTEMNDQESDVLAEYMAGTMLRHATNYNEALIYPEQSAETENSTETNETSDIISNTMEENTDKTTNTEPGIATLSVDTQKGNIISLASMFKAILNENFNITYEGYKSYSSYPDENGLFTLETTKNKKIIAATFNVKNITKKNKKLDLKNFKSTYQLTDNENIALYPMMTLLDNDIQYINLWIAAGKTQKAVILFEVPKNIDMSKMILTITYKDKTTLLDLNQ